MTTSRRARALPPDRADSMLGPWIRHGVDVWRIPLAASLSSLARLHELLSPEERTRARRLSLAVHRARFVAAHGRLRLVLAPYARRSPEELAFVTDAGGKPRLSGRSDLRFSLSHSGETALLAVAWNREVGVDLEAMRPIADLDGLADTCLSPAERAAFASVPSEHRLASLLAAWTRKEAFLKALGDGLSRPLDSFDVTLGPGTPARLLRVEGREASDWTLEDIDLGPAYRAAIAVEGRAAPIRRRAAVPSGIEGAWGSL